MEYSYALGVLLLAGVFGVFYALVPRARATMLLGTAAALPFAFLAPLFVPGYWDPPYILFGPVGLEDMAFAMTTGGLAWPLAAWAGPRRRDFDTRPARVAARLLVPVATGLMAIAGAVSLGLDPMAAALGCMVPWTLYLLAADPWLGRYIVSGAAAFGIGYLLYVRFMLWLWPDAIGVWTTGGIWAMTVMGVPLGELIWGVAYGGIWPATLAYGMKRAPVPARSAAGHVPSRQVVPVRQRGESSGG